jgi:type I restriction enzyme, R subunit
MLLRKIPAKGETSPAVELGEDVALHYYRLQKEADGDLLLAAEGEQPLYGATATGTRESKDDKVKLSTIIDLVNDRFATDFDAQDLIDGVKSQLIADDTVRKAAQVNDRANFDFVGQRRLRRRPHRAPRQTRRLHRPRLRRQGDPRVPAGDAG